MTIPLILERIILDSKTFFAKFDFQFSNNLTIIQGIAGSGKTTFLKIITLLKGNKDSITFDNFKPLFRFKGDFIKALKFQFHLNPKFLGYNHSIILNVTLSEGNLEITSEPSVSSQEIDQIIQKLKIQYINITEFISSTSLTNRVDLVNLSIIERIWKMFLEKTKNMENNLILIDDFLPRLNPAFNIQFYEYLYELSKSNQLIIAIQSSGMSEYYSDLNRVSIIQLKNPWQKSIYDFYKTENKSNYYNEFKQSIENVKKILVLKLEIDEDKVKKFIIRILYANVITALETYLSDCFIEKILKDKKIIPKLLESISEFNEKKLTLYNAYNWIEHLNDNIIDVISGISFHNLGKVKNMYKDVLNVDFPEDLGIVFNAISIRHDIVHRNGKTKDGEEIILTKQDIDELIDEISKLIKYIDSQTKKL